MAKSSRPRRPAARATSARSPSGRAVRTVFDRANYLFLVAAISLVVLGYVLMRAENAVDGVLSLYVAPLLLLAGYLGVFLAIFWRPRPVAREGALE